MIHFEGDHTKPSFWEATTMKIPGPLRKMIFDKAKREAKTKVKLLSKKPQASRLTLSDARVILDRLIKDHDDEASPLGRN